MNVKERLNQRLSNKKSFLVLVVVFSLFGIYLNHKWQADMTDSWMEGCTEGVLFMHTRGMDNVATMIFNMCVMRNQQIKEFQ